MSSALVKYQTTIAKVLEERGKKWSKLGAQKLVREILGKSREEMKTAGEFLLWDIMLGGAEAKI